MRYFLLIILITPISLFPQKPTLIVPNGAENYKGGLSTIIAWEGIPENDTVSLEFSSNAGRTWELITDEANGNEYLWDVPLINSDSCLIRAIKDKKDSIKLDWSKTYGGSGVDLGKSFTQTDDGGYIIVGGSTSVNGDKTENKGNEDLWVIKTDSIGNLLWEKSYGGSNEDRVHSVKQTFDKGYIIAGYSLSSDGDLNNNLGTRDFWILKIDSNGNVIWSKSYGGSGFDDINYIIQTEDKGYVVAGYTNSTDGDINENNGQWDFAILKLDANGNLLWNKVFGGSGDDRARGIVETYNGEIVIVGATTSNDKDISNNKGGYDYWVMKLDSEGSIIWEKTFGGSSNDFSYSIDHSDNGFIISGYSSSSNGDVSRNNGQEDFWIIKIDNDGNLIWEKSYGGSDSDIPLSIKSTSEGGIVTVGYTTSNDGDVTTNKGQWDAWILKLDNNGEFEWEKSLGGTNRDRAYRVIETIDKGYSVVGYSQSSDIDVPINKGNFDYWIAKISNNEIINGDTSDGLFSIYNKMYIYPELPDAYAGDRINLELKIKDVDYINIFDTISTFKTRIKFNSTLLLPENSNQIDKLNDDTVEIQINGNFQYGEPITTIPLIVGLGNSEKTDIIVSEIQFYDEDKNLIENPFEVRNSSFNLLGICEEGGKRLINPDGQISLQAPQPNIASNQIEIIFNSIEKGQSKLLLVDKEGTKITVYEGKALKGENRINYNLSTLPSGQYYLKLLTPTVEKTQKLIIIR